ncbi:hypothetical protein FDP41_011900 [Naegleria fowleri]|uniref:Uncharacterized protein n=1 Tax=Naegleria fowleri TaxID=5763 RepID=A0A6A5C9V2_NAEFO|nr:uncharacterized protein FDP41_011900 [Naegleria fowleri]KAF0982039.1 hypothetical protein FDP41_011900 [Naegleria fowleri]CAG4714589.1 unnamed protein product [Naegleria fowleri]
MKKQISSVLIECIASQQHSFRMVFRPHGSLFILPSSTIITTSSSSHLFLHNYEFPKNIIKSYHLNLLQRNSANKELDKYERMTTKARDLYHDKEYEKAINICTSVLEAKPDYHNAFGIRGLCNYYIEKYESAISDLNRYLEVSSMDFDTTLYRAYCNFKLYRFDEMLKDLNAIVFVTSPSEHPTRFIASRLLRSNYYLICRDADLAFADLHAIENHLGQPNFILSLDQQAQFYEGISLCYAARGLHEKAVFYLTELIEKVHKNEGQNRALNLKRAFSLVELKQFERALSDIDAYISEKGINEMPAILILRAKALHGLGKFKEALTDLEKLNKSQVLKMHPYLIDEKWLEESKKIRAKCEAELLKK